MATPPLSMHHSHTPFQWQGARPGQSGVVLIVALIMLIVISMASVAIMKGAINTDSVADNNRRQNQAMQGAQAGLRYCENQVTSGAVTPTPAIGEVAKEDWKSFDKWKAGAKEPKQPVPASFLAKTDSGAPAIANPPECMAQFRALGATQVVVITSRGFSDNYLENDKGQTQAGSVVWLQSILQVAANSTP